MARVDIRSSGENLPVTHHSARGRVQRNSGNFTRGSQLLTHELLMWFAGAKLPVLLWAMLFCIAYSVVLSLRLDEHGVQLIAMKLYAALWDWVGGDPLKRVNLTLPDDTVRRTAMGIVPHVPQVRAAWAVAMRALAGSLLIATFGTVPLSAWFIDLSRRRGRAILQERHERGALLVERDLLRSEIVAHNQAMFAREAAELLPGMSAAAVSKLSFAERKAIGIHHPYSLAGIPYPYRLEQSHSMLIGTTGAGKTTALRNLVAEMRVRGDAAVIFDLTGAYVEAFFDPARDIILNPMDERCPAWSIFADCATHAEFTSAAAALIPADGGSSEPFWALAARTLFIEMCVKLVERGEVSNRALSDNLMTADLRRVHRFLANTIADPLTAPEAARMAESIRAVFNTNAQALRFLPDEGEAFSIRDWITGDNSPGSILFVTSSYVDLPMNRTLLTLWMDIAMTRLMTMPRTRQLRVWFMFDELGALHRLPALEAGLQTARAFGGAIVLGIHSFEKLVEIYGEQGARNLASLARSKLILATADLDTAEQCARYIGNREVRQMDEAYSYGYNNTRDASTLTPRKQVEPLVIADDITNLPSMHGFVKFPDGFPAARIELHWQEYPAIAPGLVPRRNPRPAPYRSSDTEGWDDGGEGRGGEIIITDVGDREAVARQLAEMILPGSAAQASRAVPDDSLSPVAAARAPNDGVRVLSQQPLVEDLTLTELRQDFAAERDAPGGPDMGI